MSGRIYWTRTHNPVLNEIWERMEQLDGAQRIIFKHFIVSAGAIIEDLTGMGRKKQSIIRIDCKTVGREGFYQFYSALISYFSFLFGVINRSLREAIKDSAIEVTNRPQTVERIFQKLAKHYSKSTGEIHIGAFGGVIWDEIVETTKFDDRRNPGRLIYFIRMLGEVCKHAFKSIKADLGKDD